MSATIVNSSKALISSPPGYRSTNTSSVSTGMSLRRQRLLGIAVLWLILAIMIVVNAWQSRTMLYAEREQRMVTAVDIGISTIEHFDMLAQQGEITQQEAKTLAMETLRGRR